MNKQISTYFLTDARDYLKRYLYLKESATHLGLRNKLLIDLLFATECALKSLIFLESENDEKETYKEVKKRGHNIISLIEPLSSKSKKECEKIIEIGLDKYEVYGRYLVESEIDFRGKYGELDLKYYNSIANPQWFDNIYNQIEELINYVDSLNTDDKFKITRLSDIDIEKEILKHQKLSKIRKK